MKKINIYFLGSGDIAVPVLEKLLHSQSINICGIGTQIDRKGGRKRQLISTPIGNYANNNNLEIDKIPSVNSDDFISKLIGYNLDFIIVVSFGQLLKQTILNLPKIACLNVHASLLPLYRGASPIAACIANGDNKTGACFMKMDKGLDTGPVYETVEYPLNHTEYADNLEIKLGELSAEKIEKVLLKIKDGELRENSQDNIQASKVGKITKQDGILNWQEDAIDIERKIRAYFPWPGISFQLKTIKRQPRIRIVSATVIEGKTGQAGEVLEADKHSWVIACGNNALKLNKIVPEGKKEMTGAEFLRGCQKIQKGTIL